MVGRMIAAWPSFALTASYELFTRQVRRSATSQHTDTTVPSAPRRSRVIGTGDRGLTAGLKLAGTRPLRTLGRSARRGQDLQRRAWQWAMAHRAADGALPSGTQIASHFGRHERWGRLVKRAGLAGEFSVGDASAAHRSDAGAAPAGAVM
jgi:hypothetical protein